jgi:CRP/FNR family transcriptional regulator, cyclic AMP receptor protein
MNTGTDSSVERLLANISSQKTILRLHKGKQAFNQGDPADAIYYIEKGIIKITVGSAIGQEAVLMVLGPRAFFGERCLAGRAFRANSATAIEPSLLFRIPKAAMLAALDEQPALVRHFLSALVRRNEDLQEDLSAHILHPSEKRLARTLLKLARLETPEANSDVKVRKVSHQMLAEMVGTTRPHVTQFMVKFRKMGLIDYKKDLLIRTPLLAELVEHD